MCFDGTGNCERKNEPMRIRIDYKNMMSSYVGEHGIAEQELAQMKDRLDAALKNVNSKRDALRWRELYISERANIENIISVAKGIIDRAENFVVLGIGGSALGPIAVQQALSHLRHNDLGKAKTGFPRLFVEDNIDPERMSALLDAIDLEKTVFNVITKSGSTSETMAQLLIVTRLLIDRFGESELKNRLIVTTDKEKGNLIEIAKKYELTRFVVPDGVGGRFSELCPVGLLPAAVAGIDIKAMLDGAELMDALCSNTDTEKNPALMLAGLEVAAVENHGANIGVLMPYADSLKFFSDWYAQLWAESLGKKKAEGGMTLRFGQTPVKALGVTDQHSQVQLYTDGPFDKTITFIGVERFRKTVEIPHAFDENPNIAFLSGHTLNELINAERVATEYAVTVSGHMNKTILLPEVNAFTIGQLIMLFEMQTAFAGELFGIDAFDQPGVEEGKNATYALLGKPGYEEKLAELQSCKKADDKYIV